MRAACPKVLGSNPSADRYLSVWALDVVPVPAWVFSLYAGILPQSKNIRWVNWRLQIESVNASVASPSPNISWDCPSKHKWYRQWMGWKWTFWNEIEMCSFIYTSLPKHPTLTSSHGIKGHGHIFFFGTCSDVTGFPLAQCSLAGLTADLNTYTGDVFRIANLPQWPTWNPCNTLL